MTRPWTDTPASLKDLETYFPTQKDGPEPGVFEIAVACAGGTSTGPYIAGVLDFLFEALDCFEAARASDPVSVPPHKVRLVNLTGTSAGGLSAGLAALSLLKATRPMRHPAKWKGLVASGLATGNQDPSACPLYDAWVRQISLDQLLAPPSAGETDIALFAPAPGAIRDRIFKGLEALPDRTTPPAWCGPGLDLRITVGNLRGAPISLDFHNAANALGEHFVLHADHVAFTVSMDGIGGAPDSHPLPGGARFNQGPVWTLFGTAAVASSAIPFVFAPIAVIGQNADPYDWRLSRFDTATHQAQVELPAWNPRPASWDFTASDGGVFDDAPFDIAHGVLAGVEGRNLRAGNAANRALILIAPIIEEAPPTPDDPILSPKKPGPGTWINAASPLGRLVSALTAIVFAPIEQARLGAANLPLFKSEDVFSRFLISPSRESPNPARPAGTMLGPSKSLMSLPMHAVLGFACRDYREHDYFLGRRNAQRFLKTVLTLPRANPLIDASHPGWRASDLQPGDFYPLVPLRGTAEPEEPLPAWNWTSLSDADIARLTAAFKVRADANWSRISRSISGDGFFGGLKQTVLDLLLWTLFLRDKVRDLFQTALTAARDSLDPQGL